MDPMKKKAIEKISQQWIEMFRLAADGPWETVRPFQFKVQILFCKGEKAEKSITMSLRELAETNFLMIKHFIDEKYDENLRKAIARRQAIKKAIVLLEDIDSVAWEETVAQVERILRKSIIIEKPDDAGHDSDDRPQSDDQANAAA